MGVAALSFTETDEELDKSSARNESRRGDDDEGGVTTFGVEEEEEEEDKDCNWICSLWACNDFTVVFVLDDFTKAPGRDDDDDDDEGDGLGNDDDDADGVGRDGGVGGGCSVVRAGGGVLVQNDNVKFVNTFVPSTPSRSTPSYWSIINTHAIYRQYGNTNKNIREREREREREKIKEPKMENLFLFFIFC